jgi:hypothetical protein
LRYALDQPIVTMRPSALPALLAAACALTTAAPGPVRAAPPIVMASLTSKQRKAKAQKLVSQGVAAANQGIFTDALESFEQAYELYPSPKILINIGTSLRHLGRNAEAARIYELYLQDPDADPKRAKEVRRLITTIDELVGLVELDIDAPDDEFEVRLDGKLVEQEKLGEPLRVDPGEHTVVVTIGEHPTDARNVTVEAGSHIELHFEPQAMPRAGASEEEKDTAAMQGVGYALGGAGLLGVLIGTISGAVAISTDSAADDECNTAGNQPQLCDADAVELAEDARGQATLSTVAFVLGGAFLGAGAIVLVLADDEADGADEDGGDPSDELETDLGLTTLPGGGLGIGLRGRF